MPIAKHAALAALLGAGFMLGGCVENRVHLSDNFGAAVRENVAAQIADPDARYTGVPAPGGSSGDRVEMAQDHHKKGTVTPPAATSTSSATSGGK